jgi:rhamnopyranosyl-N-acetylglucosaminyl-diphospho-decaprenol beta-1,3/1,4-galactofuranosyltransferase
LGIRSSPRRNCLFITDFELEKVALIIVTFNRLDTLKMNLDHIRKQSRKPDYVLIVENGSNDGTLEYLTNQSEFDFLPMGQNIGWSGGLDIGMREANRKWGVDFFWLMDDDSFPSPMVLESLLNASRSISENAIIGLEGYIFKKGIPRRQEANEGLISVDFVLVDNALVPKKLMEVVGTPDPDYFIMAEDYEYCQRAKRNGFQVFLLCSKGKLVNRLHLGSQASSKSLIWRGYYQSRNHIFVLRDQFSWKGLMGYINRQLRFIIHAMIFGKTPIQTVKYRLMGIWDGIINKRGKTIDPLTLKRTF